MAPILTLRSGSPFTLFDCSNAFANCPHAMFTGAMPQTGVDNREGMDLQFRGEVYNAFNHSDLILVGTDNDVSSSGFASARRGVLPPGGPSAATSRWR